LTRYNFDKGGPIFIFFFSLLNSEKIAEEDGVQPLLKSVAALPCEKQVVNCTALQHC